MIIKVCGMAEVANIERVASLNPDMMGFIFYPSSPRYAGALLPEDLKCVPDSIRRVGVFVNEGADRIREIVCRYGLAVVQLHGNESPDLCYELRQDGYVVVKAIGIEARDDFEKAGMYKDCADLLLFDTKSKRYGGTGLPFDWNLLRYYEEEIPFLLSGGVSPSDVERIKGLKHVRFAGIDLNSRFEVSPGCKDHNMLCGFMEAIRRLDHGDNEFS